MSLWGFTNHYKLHLLVDLSDGFNIHFGKHDPVEESGANKYIIDPHFVGWTIVCLVYFMCEPIVGCVSFFSGMLLMKLAYNINAMDLADNLLGGHSFRIFLAIHIGGWLTQFIGHGVYESKLITLDILTLFVYFYRKSSSINKQYSICFYGLLFHSSGDTGHSGWIS